ncbi:tetratricopeptide repeat protein [Chamaesiphon sp. VAR_69_metabat_338]|uniref:tetratricopeptide repeat protein n=1 Tax=Chamaesiphon sp. VAR_69_metabat_338 TaxID=2964704 RepID=UPI00286E58FD|nr:tetratricopeptide repeat protein [Chamaesiphon sp. VAR_69_metabat_338]
MLNRHRWVINLVVAVSLLALTGFSLFPIFNLVLDGGVAVATEPNSLSTAQTNQLQSQAQGYAKVLQREPDNQVALKGLLDTRLQLGDIKGSLSPLEKIAALNPQMPDYTVLLAQTKQYLGDRDGATASYRTVLTIQPQNINALQGLVSLLIDAKRPEAAMGAVQTALKSAPANTDLTPVKLLQAQIYLTQQRNADALGIYDAAIEANRDDFRPVLAKALVFKQMGNLTQAQLLMTTAMGLAPAEYKDQIQQLAQATQPPKVSIAPNPTTPAPAAAPVPTQPAAQPVTVK